MSLLMLVSRLPKSPPWTKCLNFLVLQPPVGLESLKGQRKLEAFGYHEHKIYVSRISISAHLLEVGASSEDLVYEIFDGEDVVLAESLLDDAVVRERDTLLVNLAVAALVDQLANGLQVGLATRVY